jgi:hypothetical protein
MNQSLTRSFGIAAMLISIALPVVRSAESEKDVKALIADLDSDDAKLRDKAEAVLGEIGLPAIELVGKAALTGKTVPRFRAIRILEKLAKSDEEQAAESATKALQAVAASDDVDFAKQAKEALTYFRRLETMQQLAEAFELFDAVKDAEKVGVPLVSRPLLRFQDSQRTNLDGTLWAFGRMGRPKAMLAVYPYTLEGEKELFWSSDVVTLSDTPLRAVPTDRVDRMWSPKKTAEEWRPFPNAPPPAEDSKNRLTQVRTQIERLEARQNSAIGVKPYDLKLNPKPLHRYSDESREIIDGVVFAFVHDTNPEIIVLVEAQGKPNTVSWKFLLARHTAAPLHVDLDGKEIWSSDSSQDFFKGGENPYWAFGRRPKQ